MNLHKDSLVLIKEKKKKKKETFLHIVEIFGSKKIHTDPRPFFRVNVNYITDCAREICKFEFARAIIRFHELVLIA